MIKLSGEHRQVDLPTGARSCHRQAWLGPRYKYFVFHFKRIEEIPVMPLNGFGAALKALRERRTLSGRELSKLADLDHAYEYRLEAGEKTSPSEDSLDRLIRALKPSDRDARLLRWLAEHPDTDPKLVLYVLGDQEITLEVFTTAAGAVHRGSKPDPAKLIERVKKILEEDQ